MKSPRLVECYRHGSRTKVEYRTEDGAFRVVYLPPSIVADEGWLILAYVTGSLLHDSVRRVHHVQSWHVPSLAKVMMRLKNFYRSVR